MQLISRIHIYSNFKLKLLIRKEISINLQTQYSILKVEANQMIKDKLSITRIKQLKALRFQLQYMIVSQGR
jgi:hypothetical protein